MPPDRAPAPAPSTTTGSARRRRTWSFRIGALICGTIAVELILQLATLVSPAARHALVPDAEPLLLPDERLGMVPNPAHRDHDAWGYRNDRVPEAAEVVVLGDSQTYGTGVRRDEAWPGVLRREHGTGVYNMACGGWGPCHYLLLVEQALSLRPGTVVCAFYTGNDVFDSFRLIHLRAGMPHVRFDEGSLEAIREAEEAEPLSSRIEHFYDRARGARAGPPPRRGGDGLAQVLSACVENIRLCGLVSRIRRGWMRRGAPEGSWDELLETASIGEGHRVPVEVGGARTVLTPAYRRCALDLEDVRIRAGLRMTMEAFDRIAQRCREADVRFLLVVIPTKECVFADAISAQAVPVPPVFGELVGHERRVLERIEQFARERGIALADATSALRACLSAGESPYPMHWDGHPNPAGHRAIARTVHAALGR